MPEKTEIIYKFRWQILFLLVGVIFIGAAVFLSNFSLGGSGIEIIEPEMVATEPSEIVVEVSGAVASPGVYGLQSEARVEDAILAAGGFSNEADLEIVEKTINRASKLVDGQKIYVPIAGDTQVVGQVSGSSSVRVNVNLATKGELENLWGIGPVTAQSIIDARPIQSIEVLRGLLKSNVFERNKEILSVY